MSVPHKEYYCDSCDYLGTNLRLCGSYHYSFDEVRVPIHRKLGWCDDCSDLTAMEDFGSVEHWACRKEKLANEIERRTVGILNALLNRLSKSRRLWIDDLRQELVKVGYKIQLAETRPGTERCLQCGSQSITSFVGNDGRDLDRFQYIGHRRTGFHHPDCGGELRVKGGAFRVHFRFEDKLYDRNGLAL